MGIFINSKRPTKASFVFRILFTVGLVASILMVITLLYLRYKMSEIYREEFINAHFQRRYDNMLQERLFYFRRTNGLLMHLSQLFSGDEEYDIKKISEQMVPLLDQGSAVVASMKIDGEFRFEMTKEGEDYKGEYFPEGKPEETLLYRFNSHVNIISVEEGQWKEPARDEAPLLIPGKPEWSVKVDYETPVFISRLLLSNGDNLCEVRIETIPDFISSSEDSSIINAILVESDVPESDPSFAVAYVSGDMAADTNFVSMIIETAKPVDRQRRMQLSDGKKKWYGSVFRIDRDDPFVFVMMISEDDFKIYGTDLRRFDIILTWCFFVIVATLVVSGVQNLILHRLVDKRERYIPEPSEIEDLIQRGESDYLEFKSTLRTNLSTGKPDTKIEMAIMKTICAFLNTSGGTLLVGVTDGGKTTDLLKEDHFSNNDKLLLHFNNMIKKYIGLSSSRFIRFNIVEWDAQRILWIKSEKSKEITLLKNNDNQELYLRIGPGSRKLSLGETIAFVRNRGKARKKLRGLI